MRISLAEAKDQLTELVRRAEAGDEVILTGHGHSAVRLVPIDSATTAPSRKQVLDGVRASVTRKATDGPHAASSQDFLYDDDGMPG